MGDFSLLLMSLFVPGLLGVSFILSPLVAMAKGYKPWFWLFACGPIGLMIVAALPSLKVAKDPEEYEGFENRANWIGSILSWIALFIGFIPLFFALNQGFLQTQPIGISH